MFRHGHTNLIILHMLLVLTYLTGPTIPAVDLVFSPARPYVDQYLNTTTNRDIFRLFSFLTVIRPLIWKIGLDRATYIQKMKPEVARGGHIEVTTCQVAPIERHMLNGKHRRKLALTSNVYRSVAYNCEILNGNRPLRGILTLNARGFLTLQQFARDFIDLKHCDCLASMKVQYIYLSFFPSVVNMQW